MPSGSTSAISREPETNGSSSPAMTSTGARSPASPGRWSIRAATAELKWPRASALSPAAARASSTGVGSTPAGASSTPSRR